MEIGEKERILDWLKTKNIKSKRIISIVLDIHKYRTVTGTELWNIICWYYRSLRGQEDALWWCRWKR